MTGTSAIDARWYAPLWDGALAAVGLAAPYPIEPEPHAREQAIAALAQLPQRSPVNLLLRALDQAPSELPMRRDPRAWTPVETPRLAHEGRGRTGLPTGRSV